MVARLIREVKKTDDLAEKAATLKAFNLINATHAQLGVFQRPLTNSDLQVGERAR